MVVVVVVHLVVVFHIQVVMGWTPKINIFSADLNVNLIMILINNSNNNNNNNDHKYYFD